jgi:gamma-glutamylputrescine oxidase
MLNLLHANDHPGAYPASWYAETATPLPEFAPLIGARRADVAIIGGGYTGLSAALHLARRGYDVTLIEAHRLGFGASGRNGGQVGSGQRVEQDALERMAGNAVARALWDLGEEAKALVQKLVADYAPDAAWRPGIIHACRTEAEVRAAHAYAEKLRRDYGYDQITPLDRDALHDILPSPAYCGGDLDMGAGHVHPLRFAIGLSRAAAGAGARIYERSEAVAIRHGPLVRVETASGHVEADHLILACNGYLGGLEPRLAARVMPINNFIVATEPLGARVETVLRRDVAVADTRFVVNYFRLSEDGRLLFGGGESYGYRFPRDIRAVVRKPLLQVFPHLADVRLTHAWGGTLAITRTRLPAFVRLRDNVLAASGYSGHGVAMATLAGRLLAEALAGQAERFDLFARLPAPVFPGGAALRSPLLALAMTWFALRDRLGV